MSLCCGIAPFLILLVSDNLFGNFAGSCLNYCNDRKMVFILYGTGV